VYYIKSQQVKEPVIQIVQESAVVQLEHHENIFAEPLEDPWAAMSECVVYARAKQDSVGGNPGSSRHGVMYVKQEWVTEYEWHQTDVPLGGFGGGYSWWYVNGWPCYALRTIRESQMRCDGAVYPGQQGTMRALAWVRNPGLAIDYPTLQPPDNYFENSGQKDFSKT